MSTFRQKLEQGVAEMYGLPEGKEGMQSEQVMHDVDSKEASNFLGFIQAQKSSRQGTQS